MFMNKACYLLSALFLSICLGCTPTEKKADVPPPPKVPKQEVPAPAGKIVQDYGKGLATSVDKAKGVQNTIDTEAVRTAVKSYYFEHDKYPASLEDIRGYLKAGAKLDIYGYDPATGTVSLK
jgi:hypothetical protein